MKELYKKIDGVYNCLACEYTSASIRSSNIRSHVETHTRRQYSRTTSSSDARIDVASLNNEEIKDKVKELYNKIDGVWNCLACDYTTAETTNIKRHVEIHLDGLCYTCNICSKEFRLRNSLNHHKSTSHQK